MTNFMVVCIILAIVMLACYLFGAAAFLKKSIKNVKVWISKFKPRYTELLNGPILEIKSDGEKKYSSPIPVDKMEFTIGFSGCDLCLNDPTVEKKHAVIKKINREGTVVYLLINYGKVNPIEVYDKERQVYFMLNYKESIEIEPGERAIFRVGRNKVVIICPRKHDGEGTSGSSKLVKKLSSWFVKKKSEKDVIEKDVIEKDVIKKENMKL